MLLVEQNQQERANMGESYACKDARRLKEKWTTRLWWLDHSDDYQHPSKKERIRREYNASLAEAEANIEKHCK